MKEYDVIVIGGGILGIAHAYHCLRAGLRVALLERNEVPQEATVRNFGQVVPSGFGSRWQQLGRKSLEIYKNIQREMDITVKQEGSVYLASNDEELCLLEELAQINRANDYPSQLLTRAECQARYPGLKNTYTKGGLYFPEEITLDPRQAAQRLIQYCIRKYQLHYFPKNLVNSVLYTNGQVIVASTNQSVCYAQKVFICSGNEFQVLFPRVFENSDLELVKLQMMDTVPQPKLRIPGSVLTGWTIRRYESFQECPSFAAIKAKEAPNAYQRRLGIHILLKQAEDGSVILGDSHEYFDITDRSQQIFDTNNELNCFILSQAQKIFDLEDWRIRQTWLGQYCQCKSSEIFNHTIDHHIHIITGIGGKGMTGALGYAETNVHRTLATNLSTS